MSRYDDVREIMSEVAKDAKHSRSKIAEASKSLTDANAPAWSRLSAEHSLTWWKAAYFAQKAIWYRLYYNHL